MTSTRKFSEWYQAGWLTAVAEIEAGKVNMITAAERDIHVTDDPQGLEVWDDGYEACVCAYRLGEALEHLREDVEGGTMFAFPFDPVHTMVLVLDGYFNGLSRRDPRHPRLPPLPAATALVPSRSCACGGERPKDRCGS